MAMIFLLGMGMMPTLTLCAALGIAYPFLLGML
jgi:hypothetical protein